MFYFSMSDGNEESVDEIPMIDLTMSQPKNSVKRKVAGQQKDCNPESCYFSLTEIVESLYNYGLTSCQNWDDIIKKLKTHKNLLADLNVLKLYGILSRLIKASSDWVSSQCVGENEHNYEEINLEIRPLEHFLIIFSSILTEKEDTRVSYKTSQKLFTAVRVLLGGDSPTGGVKKKSAVQKKNQSASKIEKKVKYSNGEAEIGKMGFKFQVGEKKIEEKNGEKGDSSGGDEISETIRFSSDSEATCDVSSPKRVKFFSGTARFANCFKNMEKTAKGKMHFVQTVQYKENDKRHKMFTPGETGTHLIKIEITKTKDLKNCQSTDDYYHQVSSKGIFLIDVKREKGSAILRTLEHFLGDAAEQISQIVGKRDVVEELDSNGVAKNNGARFAFMNRR